ncbi:hypothetical protein [Nitrososphaeria virus YSH_174770]|uniref:Uncharacterized protein n=1 Tax=Nitrososphaeria virus YSH_174770 TaxID=3071322 RepID=A0A976YF61_9CAUD|nr:hypothetical protein QKV93_gp49 [Yangshan Harbor Nitrososphaeria virus]UVF62394.1 hypothetical protein [Nitrososphaeria virus YSH_174770]
MQVIDVYTKKVYTCNKCNKEVFYGKVTDNDGNIYTTDGMPFNNKFGKESNAISGAVLTTDKVSFCCDEKKQYAVDAVAKAQPPATAKPKREFVAEYLSEPQQLLWKELVAKHAEYVILAQQVLNEYPEIENPALKGLTTNNAFNSLLSLKEQEFKK